jgi:site-specific DNA-cytosine methylase
VFSWWLDVLVSLPG